MCFYKYFLYKIPINLKCSVLFIVVIATYLNIIYNNYPNVSAGMIF